MRVVIGAIVFAVFCLLLSFALLITDSGFTFLLLENKDAVQPTRELFGYFFGGSMPEVFNANEASHLRDVRFVIWGALSALVACAIFLWKNKGKFIEFVERGTLVLVISVIVSVIVPFDSLFTYFHFVFFPQGNWMFPADSTIITFYPKAFFLKYAVAISANAVAIALTLTVVELLKSDENRKIYKRGRPPK